MPEGPEIRRAADAVECALKNRTVEDAYFALPHLEDYEDLFKGSVVSRVDTKGKAMLIRFDNGYTIYSHNQLYGKWMIRNTYNYPKTNRQLRLALHNEKKSALLYSASDIEVLRNEEVPEHPFIAKVGPDLLSEDVTVDDLLERIQDKRFRNRKWAILLLDQGFVAGIGNYLRSEILYVAGIHPSLRPADCTEDQHLKAAQGIIDLVRRSYETGGITNDPSLVQKLKDQGVKRSRYRHWVFNREGAACFVCGTEIEKTVAASRRLYYCPHCQKI
ncbi:endonuclease VIII [Bacillus sp. KH172YL63]|uniref:endonuclease VIII n=1 Tax=Bacillus sp. KH172YL63 TaxID=2709784 RepID=UPI0013E43B9B|nr:endonuclease VIII [Bacillus sp. KH172YL63]BCB02620.1 endonuclease 8 [Bacillus sp. KH172YL63]